MMAATAFAVAPKGQSRPRIAPPSPARSDIAGICAVAEGVGIHFMPWQMTAARYLEARGRDKRHLYREVAVVASRQNGKNEILVPLIVKRLREGKRIMHTAQDRSLPRDIFYRVADIMWEQDAALFPMRNGRPTKPRYANGQEEIRLSNGGIYSIVAPTRSGARGPTRDLVIVDEVREMDSWEFMAAAKPTMTVSEDPQMVYLSNAGDESSVVLNALRERAGKDPSLAYLEWSAESSRAMDDVRGWAEANPAMGHEPKGMGQVRASLEAEFLANKLAGTLAIFEAEHLTRWVPTLRKRLVDDLAWKRGEAAVETPTRSFMAISLDPQGRRASAAIAWPQADGTIGLRLLFDVTGSPINTDKLGPDLRDAAKKYGAAIVGFDPLTDAVLAKVFPKSEAITGQKFTNASARFVAAVEGGRVKWADCGAVTSDLVWTARKEDDATGSFEAVRGNDERPITAALAAIRAVWLASEPVKAPYRRKPQKAVGF
jgi:hypothetical protein